MNWRCVVITGANSGIGFECAKILSQDSSLKIVLAGRSRKRLEEAARLLPTQVELLEMDLSSLSSVRAATENLLSLIRQGTLPPISSLVLNAGMQVAGGAPQFTQDGFELTFGTNYLGHFLLANLMLPHTVDGGRIVITSSGTHDPETMAGRFNKPIMASASHLAYPDALGAPRMSQMQRYATSKLCNLLMSYELARRLLERNSQTTSNALDPGAVPTTGLLRGHGRLTRTILAGTWIRHLGVRIETPYSAGRALARLVTDPSLDRVTGKYFEGETEGKSSQQSYDVNLARRLWNESRNLVGLREEEGL